MFYVYSALIFAIVKKKEQVRLLRLPSYHTKKEKKKSIFSIINSELYETAATYF